MIYRNNNYDINNMKSSTYTRGKKRNGAEQNLFYSPNIFNTQRKLDVFNPGLEHSRSTRLSFRFYGSAGWRLLVGPW